VQFWQPCRLQRSLIDDHRTARAAMTFAEAAPFLTGPASALFVALLGFLAIYRTFNSTMLPLLSGAIDRHLQQIDDLARRQQAEHQAIIDQLQKCNQRLDRLIAQADWKQAQ